MDRFALILVIPAIVCTAACSRQPASPSTSAIVTFRVVNETFKVLMTDTSTIASARSVLAGTSKRFPNGRIVAGADVNTGWSWHLTDVEMVEASIEVCDGRPSDVERAGPSYGGGRYCPWSATVASIQDQ